MLTFLFSVLLLIVFGKLLLFGISATWGIAKLLCTVVLLPLALILLVVVGLIYIALPILLLGGIFVLFGKAFSTH